MEERRSEVLEGDPFHIAQEHGSGAAVGKVETSRIWKVPALRGTELFYGSYRRFEFARHYHSVAAIGVVEKGMMESFVQGTDYLAPAGTVVLLNAGDVHAPHSTDDSGWSFRIFFFDEAFLRRKFPACGEGVVRFRAPYVQDEAAAKRLLELHRQMERMGATLELESAMGEVLTQLAEHHAGASLEAPLLREEPEKIRRAREYIDAHCLSAITLERLSEIAGLSEYHMVRAFTQVEGLPPHTYQMQRRIEVAKRMLRRGEPIASVALETGFVDQTHFSRNFKRILGVTPGQYYPRLKR